MCIPLPTERGQWGHIHLYQLVCLLLPADSGRVKHILHQQQLVHLLLPVERAQMGCALHWHLYQLICGTPSCRQGTMGTHLPPKAAGVLTPFCREHKWNVFSTNICTSWYAYPFLQTGAKGDTFFTNSSWYAYPFLQTGAKGDTFFTNSSWYAYPFLQTGAKGTHSSPPSIVAELWYSHPFPQMEAKWDRCRSYTLEMKVFRCFNSSCS